MPNLQSADTFSYCTSLMSRSTSQKADAHSVGFSCGINQPSVAQSFILILAFNDHNLLSMSYSSDKPLILIHLVFPLFDHHNMKK